MVGTLPRGGSSLGWVADNSECRLVTGDLNAFDVVSVALVQNGVEVLRDHVDQAVDGTGTLMLVESQFEVHVHHSEVVSGLCEQQVKWRLGMAAGWLELSEDGLRIPEDILWSDEASDSSMD